MLKDCILGNSFHGITLGDCLFQPFCLEQGQQQQLFWYHVLWQPIPMFDHLHRKKKRLFLRFKHFFFLYFDLCLLPLGPFTKHYWEERGSIFSTAPIKYLYKLIWSPWAFSRLKSPSLTLYDRCSHHYYVFFCKDLPKTFTSSLYQGICFISFELPPVPWPAGSAVQEIYVCKS